MGTSVVTVCPIVGDDVSSASATGETVTTIGGWAVGSSVSGPIGGFVSPAVGSSVSTSAIVGFKVGLFDVGLSDTGDLDVGLILGFMVTFVIVGCTEGDNVGEDVTGLTNGEFVGSSVVGLALGLFDGESVTGLLDGDNVGEDVTGLVVGLNVGGFVTGERVGDRVEIVDVMVGADDGDVGQNSRRAGVISSCVYVGRDIV